jgi:Fe-S-cluster containining protein
LVDPEGIDCKSCGACCISSNKADTYVYVGDGDVRRLRLAYTEKTVRRLVSKINDPFEIGVRTKTNVQGLVTCISLRGSVGKQCSCSIYDARPDACREFIPSEFACLAARKSAEID